MTEDRPQYRVTGTPDELAARVAVLEKRLARLAAAVTFLLESIDHGSERQAARELIEVLAQDFETKGRT